DSVEYSVMTYRSFPGQDLSNGGGYTNEDWGYPQTLMMYDIAALQQIYGANYNTNSGNTTYRWSATTGELSINNVGQGAPGDGNGVTSASENRVLMTVWDGGGTDTYDFSLYSGGSTIDLRPGEWSTTSQTQLANLRDSAGGPSFARGNIANALMFEGNTASLIENAVGSGGADSFFANQVANLLTGGGGADTFRWASASDAGTGGLADTIADLTRGSDLIHLGDIDANSGTGANDAFAFIGTSAFHSVAGELRYQVEGGNARIQADLDGNGLADMEIIVNNNTILAGTDFIL
ncbi:MAG TPA: M10 family metallopeptidase C-terminal domain-containing protein, partial [Allosphingosinicella sp.]|nr:M10 family metallopeptidase C-terminal domain-containing protein [Allosphingosinicella sp.]